MVLLIILQNKDSIHNTDFIPSHLSNWPDTNDHTNNSQITLIVHTNFHLRECTQNTDTYID